MKADHLSFSRAATVCLLGLILQLGMGVILLIYGQIGADHTAQTSAYLILCGSIVWLSLAIVFDQHRRERIEAMEADSLSGLGGRAASVFDTNPDDLRVAARRLAWMHRFFLPAISIVLAGAYAGIGAWRIFSARELLEPDKFVLPAHRGWAMAIGLALAVIGFIFARFVSGMAKQPVWGNLRGGAAVAVGAAIMGLAIAVSHFVHFAGSDWLLRNMQVAAPAVMIFLGAEILLNLVLNLYRPRKPGEIPRPAIDSRVLAFVASPDRLAESIGGAISYQFGVDVTGSWAYQLISRSVLLLALVVAGVIWLLTCVDIIEPDQRALRVRNGRSEGEVGPGLYFKLPWPFETLDTFAATGLREQQLATQTPANKGPILWTNDHAVKEVFAIVQPTAAVAKTGEEPGGVRDIALVSIEVPLRYNIKDLSQFETFASPGTREGLIRAVARREILTHLAACNEDDVLGRRITDISLELRRRVQGKLDELKAGVNVVSVSIEGVHPEKNAARSFETIVDNLQKQQGALEQGRTQAIKSLTAAVGSVDLARTIVQEIDRKDAKDPPEAREARIEALIAKAGGSAGSMIARAKAERWQRHMQERGRAEAFGGQLAAYRAAPSLYKAQLYFASLRDLMKGARVYITPADVWPTIDLKDPDNTGNVLTAPSSDR